MHRVLMRLVALVALAASVFGIAAAGAMASTASKPAKPKVVKVTGGSATLSPTTATVTTLAGNGIVPSAVAPAKLSGTSLVLPVAGGFSTTRKFEAIIALRGGVTFTKASKKFTLRRMALSRLGGHNLLTGVVAGKLVKVANLTGVSVKTSGKQATVTGTVRLTATAAKLVNTLASKHIVSGGYDFGSLSSTLKLK